MTFIDWNEPDRHGEAPERFRVGAARARPARSGSVALCPQCVLEEIEPYWRLQWTVDWIAACPRHATVLITRCPQCHVKLRMPSPFCARTFSARVCSHCRTPFACAHPVSAHRRVVQLQTAPITAQQSGAAELALLGHMRWAQLRVLAVSVLRIFWTVIIPADRTHLLSLIAYDLCVPLNKDPGRWQQRYESLAVLTWLLEVPRYNPSAHFTADDLSHWMTRHAYPALDKDARALLHSRAMTSALTTRLHDLLSLLSPLRYTGRVAMRAGLSAATRPSSEI